MYLRFSFLLEVSFSQPGSLFPMTYLSAVFMQSKFKNIYYIYYSYKIDLKFCCFVFLTQKDTQFSKVFSLKKPVHFWELSCFVSKIG